MVQFPHQRGEDPGAIGLQRVPQRDGGAIHAQFVEVGLVRLLERKRHARKRLVHFVQVDLINRWRRRRKDWRLSTNSANGAALDHSVALWISSW